MLLGPLSDLYGRRPVLLASLDVFVIASFACALSGDILTFLVARMVQGAVVSAVAISHAVVRDTVPAADAVSLLGYIGMAMTVAPMLGLILGGLIDMTLGWRMVFVLLGLLGILAFVVTLLDLGENNTARSASFSDQFRTYPELFRRGVSGDIRCARPSHWAAFMHSSAAHRLWHGDISRLHPRNLDWLSASFPAGFFLAATLRVGSLGVPA